MKTDLIFVTGFFGAPIEERARALAEEKGYGYLSLDEEIERADGRSVRRICMLMGEHEYRNKEYEILSRISETENSLIICCGDGVLHDDMCRTILERHTLVIVGGELSCAALWENAKDQKESYHAFLHFGTEKDRRDAFLAFHERQTTLFEPYMEKEN